MRSTEKIENKTYFVIKEGNYMKKENLLLKSSHITGTKITLITPVIVHRKYGSIKL